MLILVCDWVGLNVSLSSEENGVHFADDIFRT